MNMKLRMILLVGALLGSGVMVGMTPELIKIREDRFKAQRAAEAEAQKNLELKKKEDERLRNIERLNLEIEHLDWLLKGRQTEKQALLNDPEYQRVLRDIGEAQNNLLEYQGNLEGSKKRLADTQREVANLRARVNSLNEQEQINLLSYEDNIQNFQNQVFRLEQDIEYNKGLIFDLNKRIENIVDALKNIQEIENTLAQKRAEIKILKDQLKVEGQRPPLDELRSAAAPLKDYPKNVFTGTGVQLSGKQKLALSAGAAAIVAGMFYVGLRWYQKKQISNVVAKYGRMQDDFSARQRDMMAAAVLASSGVPGTMRYLQSLVSRYDVGSEGVFEDMMWQILAELYWRKSVNARVVQAFKIKVAGAA